MSKRDIVPELGSAVKKRHSTDVERVNQPHHGPVGLVWRSNVGWAATDRNVTFEFAEKVG